MRLEIGALGESFGAAVKGADEGAIAGVYANVGAEVEVERELLAAGVEGTLERLLARVHELVALELARLLTCCC